jgi:hypothetical protein
MLFFVFTVKIVVSGVSSGHLPLIYGGCLIKLHQTIHVEHGGMKCQTHEQGRSAHYAQYAIAYKKNPKVKKIKLRKSKF